MTTRSPGASVGTSTSFTYARKRSPVMEPSSIRVAVTPLSPARPRAWFLAIPVQDQRAQPYSSRGAAVPAGHVGGRKALVDEHEPLRIEVEPPLEPVLTLLRGVRLRALIPHGNRKKTTLVAGLG